MDLSGSRWILVDLGGSCVDICGSYWILSGYFGATGREKAPHNPSMGSVVSRFLRPRQSGLPTYVNINDGGFGYHGAAFLGAAYNPINTGSYSYGKEGIQFASINESRLELQKKEDELRVIENELNKLTNGDYKEWCSHTSERIISGFENSIYCPHPFTNWSLNPSYTKNNNITMFHSRNV